MREPYSSDPRAGKIAYCLFRTVGGIRVIATVFEPRIYSSPTAQIRAELHEQFRNPEFRPETLNENSIEKIHRKQKLQ